MYWEEYGLQTPRREAVEGASFIHSFLWISECESESESEREGRTRRRRRKMATLQLIDYCNPVIVLKPSIKSIFIKTDNRNYGGASRVRIVPRACLQKPSLTRRHLLAETAAISVAPLILGIESPAKSEEPVLSEWERVYLPIDPGVVLLDIAFVPDDLNHGLFILFSSFLFFSSFTVQSELLFNWMRLCPFRRSAR